VATPSVIFIETHSITVEMRKGLQINYFTENTECLAMLSHIFHV